MALNSGFSSSIKGFEVAFGIVVDDVVVVVGETLVEVLDVTVDIGVVVGKDDLDVDEISVPNLCHIFPFMKIL